MESNVEQYPVGTEVRVTESARDWDTWPVGAVGKVLECEHPTYAGQAAYRVEIARVARWVHRIEPLDQEEEWRREFTQAAHTYANRAGWSTDFDDFMEQHGLARRPQYYRVEVDVTVRLTLQVEAIDQESAREKALAMAEVNDLPARLQDSAWERVDAVVNSSRTVGVAWR